MSLSVSDVFETPHNRIGPHYVGTERVMVCDGNEKYCVGRCRCGLVADRGLTGKDVDTSLPAHVAKSAIEAFNA